jgi:hypothetical protein
MRLPLLIFAGFALAAPALAQSPSDARLNADLARADRQQARLDAGAASGRVNPREAAVAEHRLGRIDNGIERLSADGRYSRLDAQRIDQRQDRSSRQLVRARSNRR